MPIDRTPDRLRLVALMLCERCLAGEGGECHTPGCALYMNRAPDVPVTAICDLKAEIVEQGDRFVQVFPPSQAIAEIEQHLGDGRVVVRRENGARQSFPISTLLDPAYWERIR